MVLLYRGHAAANDGWLIERWHVAATAAPQRFIDQQAAARWLRGFRIEDLRRVALEQLDALALQRSTNASLSEQLGAMIVAGQLRVAPAFGQQGHRGPGETSADERLLRRLRTTSHSFHFRNERYRVVEALQWAGLRGSDDECWQVLPQQESQALLTALTRWTALSVDEQQALGEAVDRVPEAWRPQRPVPGMLLLRIVPVVTLFKSVDDGRAATPSQLAGRSTEEELHWVQIELIDAEDQPVPGELYRIELPGGELREGRLDTEGRAYIGGLKQGGTCKVCFPDIDSKEWRAA